MRCWEVSGERKGPGGTRDGVRDRVGRVAQLVLLCDVEGWRYHSAYCIYGAVPVDTGASVLAGELC